MHPPARRLGMLLALVRAQLDASDSLGALETRAQAVLAADRSGDPLLLAQALSSLDGPGLWPSRALVPPAARDSPLHWSRPPHSTHPCAGPARAMSVRITPIRIMIHFRIWCCVTGG
jgi:hypothetical protein